MRASIERSRGGFEMLGLDVLVAEAPRNRMALPSGAPGRAREVSRLVAWQAVCDRGWRRSEPLLLDDLVGTSQERRRDRQAEGLRGLCVNPQFELRRSLDGEITRLRAPENPINVAR